MVYKNRAYHIGSYYFSQPERVSLTCVVCEGEFERVQEGRQNPGRVCRRCPYPKGRKYRRDCVVCKRLLKKKQKFTCSSECRRIRNNARNQYGSETVPAAMPVGRPGEKLPSAATRKRLLAQRRGSKNA